MTREELTELFEKHDNLYLELRGGRPDLEAFNLLDKIAPSIGDIIAAAEHDEFWLSTDLDTLAAAATEDDIVFLIRRGIRLDDDTDSLAMFA